MPCEKASWKDYDDMVLKFSDFIFEDKDIPEGRESIKTSRQVTLSHFLDTQLIDENIPIGDEGAQVNSLEVPPQCIGEVTSLSSHVTHQHSSTRL